MRRIRLKTHAPLVIGRPKRELRRGWLLLLMARMKLCMMMSAKRRMVAIWAEWSDRGDTAGGCARMRRGIDGR